MSARDLKFSKGIAPIGMLVRLKLGVSRKPGRRTTARVQLMLHDIKGGVRLDKPLDGFRYWNMADIEMVPLCGICKNPLDVSPERRDCGGDCLMCMAEAGDPDCIRTIQQLEKRRRNRSCSLP